MSRSIHTVQLERILRNLPPASRHNSVLEYPVFSIEQYYRGPDYFSEEPELETFERIKFVNELYMTRDRQKIYFWKLILE